MGLRLLKCLKLMMDLAEGEASVDTDNMVIVLSEKSKYRTEHSECHQSENLLKQNIIKGQKYLQCQILCSIFNILLLPKQNKQTHQSS